MDDMIRKMRAELTVCRTPEEIEKLKKSWAYDPCWDIEDSEGFEAHYEELKAWRLDTEKKHELAEQARRELRREKVMNATGIGKADSDILDALSTWGEIERGVSAQDVYMGDFTTRESIVMAELAGAQIRATLLLAAQVKRIADALEELEDGATLIRSAKSWDGE